MMLQESETTELVPLNTIRVETVISRYPVHCLATNKHGNVMIDISEQDENGETSLKWKVSPSRDFGHPGPLAYKIDTLIINRRIEEARPRVPRLIRLGSLSDLCRELGLADSGKNRADIKNALYQNALVGIVPHLRYRQVDGSEDTLETAFNRYAVILTGKKLPDGRKADGVYIVLSDVYMHVLNGAMTRPLDYDYLKSLPPAPQRFYELLSYQMYAALKYDRPRAKLTYSAFCAHAPQKRYTVWKRVRSQMTSIHRKHQESGYIADVDYQESVDKDGKPDWIMLYKPGPKARAEYRASMKRGGPTLLEIEPLDFDAADPVEPLLIGLSPAAEPPAGQEPPPPPLVAELISRGVTKMTAEELVQRHPAEFLERKIEVFDWRVTQPKPPKEPAGYLVKSITDDYATPKHFVSRADRERQAEAKRQVEQKAAEDLRRRRKEEARDQAARKAATAYWDSLTPEQQAELDAAMDAQADAETLANEKGELGDTLRRFRRHAYIRQLIESRQPELAD